MCCVLLRNKATEGNCSVEEAGAAAEGSSDFSNAGADLHSAGTQPAKRTA